MKKRVACAAALFVIWGWGWISPPQAWAQLSSLVVTMTSPTSGSTVSGTITVRASVSIIGALTVEGVQFQLDGANLGAEDTTAPYSVPWDTTGTSNGSHSLRAVARDAFGIRYISDTVTVTVSNAPPPDTTPPTVSITSPANGEPVSGTRSVTATASDNVGVAGVQFFVDGSPLGTEDTTAPFSRPWDTTSASNASHTLTAVARDAAGNSTTSAPVTVSVSNAPPPDTTPPTVSLTAPANGQSVSGTTPVSATASDNVGVTQVQFLLDGTTSLGVDTTAPYSVSWNTTATSDGSHTLTAVARDAAGNTATSAPVTVTVSNAPPAPTITSFSPTSGPVGTSVTINGTNFTGASSVTFNGTSATFSVTSATVIQATVPSGATTGPISVTTPGGTATSVSAFTVSNGPPASGGDVFVPMANAPVSGTVQWRNPDGSLRRILTGNSDGQASSVAFDAAQNLYVPHWCKDGNCLSPHNRVERFDANGNLLGTFGRDASGNNPYNCNPSSLAFDAAGNVYVGQADCTGNILKFDAAGNLVASFTVLKTNRGTDHIDLASDGCTMFYSSRDKNIYRFNVCTNTQLLPFNSQPLPGSTAFHIRILPDGGILVADFEMIARLDSGGNLIQTYSVPGQPNVWGGVDFVGDGTFWASNAATDNIVRFDLQSGNVLTSFNTGTGGGHAAGVGVRR